MQQSCAIYAEKGGVGKSTTTVGLAGALARRGQKVLVWDLDPRATTTTWLDIEPRETGLHVGAIFAAPDPAGWVEDMVVDVPWSVTEGTAMIKAVPSDRNLALREAESGEYPEGKIVGGVPRGQDHRRAGGLRLGRRDPAGSAQPTRRTAGPRRPGGRPAGPVHRDRRRGRS